MKYTRKRLVIFRWYEGSPRIGEEEGGKFVYNGRYEVDGNATAPSISCKSLLQSYWTPT